MEVNVRTFSMTIAVIVGQDSQERTAVSMLMNVSRLLVKMVARAQIESTVSSANVRQGTTV